MKKDYSFFTVTHDDTRQIGEDVVSIEFELNSDKILHTRQIYSVLDYLSDVGGIFDMIKLIG